MEIACETQCSLVAPLKYGIGKLAPRHGLLIGGTQRSQRAEQRYHSKYRRKALYGPLRQHLGPVFRELARQKECEVVEGHLMPDHVHMLISIPPKYSVSAVMGFIKGKSAIHIARVYAGKRRNFVGQHFWARGYLVSTVGKDEGAVRK